MIGGNLSYPAERYPRIFGRYQLLREYVGIGVFG